MKTIITSLVLFIAGQAMAENKTCLDILEESTVAIVSDVQVGQYTRTQVELKQPVYFGGDFGTLPVGIYNVGENNPLNDNAGVLRHCNEGAYLSIGNMDRDDIYEDIYLVCREDSSPTQIIPSGMATVCYASK